MDLTSLHLEEMIVLPNDYKKIIEERRELTPELEAKGFRSAYLKKEGYRLLPEERYNVRYTVFSKKIEELFEVTVMEEDIHLRNGSPKILYQLIIFDIRPFSEKMMKWYNDGYGKLYFGGSYKYVGEMLNTKKEKDFYKILETLSAYLRQPDVEVEATPTSNNEEPEISINGVDYKNSDLKGRDYNDLANHVLTPLIAKGLAEGLKVFRKNVKNEVTDDSSISIDLNKERESMMFYYGSDSCEGQAFFEYKLGAVVSVILKNKEITYRQELSHWFSDAVARLPEKAYKGLNVSVEVPEVGGDPYLENFE